MCMEMHTDVSMCMRACMSVCVYHGMCVCVCVFICVCMRVVVLACVRVVGHRGSRCRVNHVDVGCVEWGSGVCVKGGASDEHRA